MEEQSSIIFQIDSPLVNEVYDNNSNYQNCAIYFCSNEIYYPNTEDSFRTNIIEKDKYEWYNIRVPNTYKHIFIRDIKKQWYLSGINSTINTPQLLLEFLKKETAGYRITLVGSSAGGFAAALYGSLLEADSVYSFNGQFEIASLLKSSSPQVDPFIFRYADNRLLRPYFDVKNFLNNSTNIYYFYSAKSEWDNSQFEHIKKTCVYSISFISSHHGVPFLKSCLPVIFKLGKDELEKISQYMHLPLLFTVKKIGIMKTVYGILTVGINKINKSKRVFLNLTKTRFGAK